MPGQSRWRTQCKNKFQGNRSILDRVSSALPFGSPSILLGVQLIEIQTVRNVHVRIDTNRNPAKKLHLDNNRVSSVRQDNPDGMLRFSVLLRTARANPELAVMVLPDNIAAVQFQKTTEL